jgi:hypothetical protein
MQKILDTLPSSTCLTDEHTAEMIGFVEAITPSQIKGWVVSDQPSAIELSLVFNNIVQPVLATWHKRADVDAQFKHSAHAEVGFIFDIPFALTRIFMLALQENQPINVYANGCPLNMTDNLVHTRLLKKHVHKSPKLSNVLVCIGAQKAGTSWLFQNLTKDERFAKCMFAKEVHYFDHLYKNSPHLNNWRAVHFLKVCQGDKDKLKQLTPFISAMLADDASLLQALIEDADGLSPALARRIGLLTKKINDAWYVDLLRTTKQRKYALDITPEYALIGEAGFTHMKSITENLKIIFILREPSERAWSSLLQGKKNEEGGINAFLMRYGKDIDYLFNACTKMSDISLRNDYLLTLEDLEKAGLLNQVLIKFYDDIVANPAQLMHAIYDFIDLPLASTELFADTLHQRIHATQKTKIPAELQYRLKAHYQTMLNEITTRYVTLPDAWFIK